MNKPIEPGCLCVVVSGHPSIVGESCTAVQWANVGDEFMANGRLFENYTPVSGWAVEFVDGCGIFEPYSLRRIDGGDPDAAQQHDQEVPSHAHA